jgi:hypothetical protein
MLTATPALASPEIPKPPLILPSDMLDYGMWREEHDRATFPRDFPLQGEPYDWATGNAIRAVNPNPLPKGDRR